MRLMKSLRELKYDLLFEQQLYRKYLDDYDKLKDKDKAEKVKAALMSDVTVFKDMQSGKLYVVKKSGEDGYSQDDQGRIIVKRDAFFQGDKGNDGKVMDNKSGDGGAGAAASREPAAGEPTEPPPTDTPTDKTDQPPEGTSTGAVSYTHLRAHET